MSRRGDKKQKQSLHVLDDDDFDDFDLGSPAKNSVQTPIRVTRSATKLNTRKRSRQGVNVKRKSPKVGYVSGGKRVRIVSSTDDSDGEPPVLAKKKKGLCAHSQMMKKKLFQGKRKRSVKTERIDDFPLIDVEPMKSYFRPVQFRSRRIATHTNVDAVATIKKVLDDRLLGIFRQSCFGHFIDMPAFVTCNKLLNSLLLREVCPPIDDDDALWFDFYGNKLRFGLVEFGLITGLKCVGNHLKEYHSDEPNRLLQLYFGGASKVTKKQLVDCFLEKKWKSDEDAIKLAALYFIHTFLFSTKNSATNDTTISEPEFNLVECGEWQTFPWGTKVFLATVTSMHDKLRPFLQCYRFAGLPYALQVWFYESCPTVNEKIAFRVAHKSPRILNWHVKRTYDFDELQKGFFSLKKSEVCFTKIEPSELEVANFELPEYKPYNIVPNVSVDPVSEESSGEGIHRARAQKVQQSSSNSVKHRLSPELQQLYGQQKLLREELTGLKAYLAKCFDKIFKKLDIDLDDNGDSNVCKGVSGNDRVRTDDRSHENINQTSEPVDRQQEHHQQKTFAYQCYGPSEKQPVVCPNPKDTDGVNDCDNMEVSEEPHGIDMDFDGGLDGVVLSDATDTDLDDQNICAQGDNKTEGKDTSQTAELAEHSVRSHTNDAVISEDVLVELQDDRDVNSNVMEEVNIQAGQTINIHVVQNDAVEKDLGNAEPGHAAMPTDADRVVNKAGQTINIHVVPNDAVEKDLGNAEPGHEFADTVVNKADDMGNELGNGDPLSQLSASQWHELTARAADVVKERVQMRGKEADSGFAIPTNVDAHEKGLMNECEEAPANKGPSEVIDDVTPFISVRERKTSKFNKSPFTTEFGSSGASAELTKRRIFCLTHPLLADIRTEPDYQLITDWCSWIDRKVIAKSKVGNIYPARENNLHPVFNFGVHVVDKKEWFHVLNYGSKELSTSHLDVLFYYLRKKAKFDRDISVKVSTTDCQFDGMLKAVHAEFLRAGRDIRVVDSSVEIMQYISGGGLRCNRPWVLLDDVLFPVKVVNDWHWILARLSFKDRTIYVYDSDPTSAEYNEELICALEPYATMLPLFLYAAKIMQSRTELFYKGSPYEGISMADPFILRFLGRPLSLIKRDYGVFAAAFAEYFIQFQSMPSVTDDLSLVRSRYAMYLWNYGKNKQIDCAVSDDDI